MDDDTTPQILAGLLAFVIMALLKLGGSDGW